ncbi:MAG: DUF3570 domain-containing protein [Myxococcales bacterium]|nr:DUF3570 domain-containing protein [Myxococcales bacterium]
MRRIAVIVVAALGLAGVDAARADGELTMRGVYYKERATRVEQPMLDGRFDVGDHGTVDAHLLVDAITSASASASAFDEKRVEGGLGYAHVFGRYTAAATARYSSEPDYKSAFGTVRGQAELFDKNVTVGLTLGVGRDDVTNAGAATMMRVAGTLDSYLISASASQILGENTTASLVYDLSYLDGFQQNPYRQVAVAGSPTLERHPSARTRHAAAVVLKRFVPATATTVVASYRLYRDDWGILAHTPEVRVIQDAGDTVWFGAGYRYHRQTGADFWQGSYTEAQPFLSADPKLSQLTTHNLAARLGVTGATFGLEDRWADVRAEVMLEYYIQADHTFGNATIAHAALTLPLEY